MKLSTDTIDILKSFKTINPQFRCKPGSDVRITAPMGNVIGHAVVQEKFDTEFAIYDLNHFFDTLSLFDAPEINFGENSMQISDPTANKEYAYCLSNIPKYVENIKLPGVAVTLDLDEKVLPKILKAAAAEGHKDVIFSGVIGEPVFVTVTDLNANAKGKKANEFKIKLADKSDHTFSFIFMESCLNLFPGKYKLEFAKSTISQFTNLDKPIKYWIAVGKDSKFEE